jgi:hypothetical protein
MLDPNAVSGSHLSSSPRDMQKSGYFINAFNTDRKFTRATFGTCVPLGSIDMCNFIIAESVPNWTALPRVDQTSIQ